MRTMQTENSVVRIELDLPKLEIRLSPTKAGTLQYFGLYGKKCSFRKAKSF